MSLTIVLNGQNRTFALESSRSIEGLVEELGLKGDRIAIEQNGEIVPRSEWPQTDLQEGDRLELVHFVGGGRV